MIYIVSGFMRSGTSMMMEALIAGGMQAYYSQEREKYHKAQNDGEYKLNPKDLYEPKVAETIQRGFPTQHEGKLIKFVAPWLPKLSANKNSGYKVLYMLRDLEEIRQSCMAGLELNLTCEQIETVLLEQYNLLKVRRDVKNICVLHYDQLLAKPKESLSDLKSWGWPFDVDKSAEVINQKHKRFEKSNLAPGVNLPKQTASIGRVNSDANIIEFEIAKDEKTRVPKVEKHEKGKVSELITGRDYIFK